MKVSVLTVSDRSSRGEREDKSGPLLNELVQAQGWDLIQYQIVSDQQSEIEKILCNWVDNGDVNLILTTGGTGFSPRDQVPEATLSVVERLVPGIAEAMRSASLKITPHAMLSRAVAGIRGRTLIVNLPGSPKAVKENFEIILPALPHAIQLLTDDPNAEAGHYPGPMKKQI
jgi:molybdopterin adenylyltransferase